MQIRRHRQRDNRSSTHQPARIRYWCGAREHANSWRLDLSKAMHAGRGIESITRPRVITKASRVPPIARQKKTARHPVASRCKTSRSVIGKNLFPSEISALSAVSCEGKTEGRKEFSNRRPQRIDISNAPFGDGIQKRNPSACSPRLRRVVAGDSRSAPRNH
jgi:hypothetical protein